MTQIIGKLYQMKNAAGTENRFPITVMEAVLGLNSYLQTQFSNLADIYMPIEGITESKPMQEFVYRKSAATIKAKSLTLDRILGKTQVWNQLVPSSYINFTNSTTDAKTSPSNIVQWYSAYSIISYESVSGALGDHNTIVTAPTNANTVAFKHSGSVANIDYISNGIVSVVAGHKYLLKYKQVSADPTTVGGLVVNGINITDLTQMFGAGNEPSTVAEFEARYPGYHDYSAGKLISNDAESLETVGFNQWDGEYEVGIYDSANGVKHDDSHFYRTANYTRVLPSTDYYYKAANTNTRVFFYGPNYEYIGSDNTIKNSVFSTPANCYYITFFWLIEGSVGYPCINLSDPAKNGTYEPYWERTIQLGLSTLTGKLNGQGASVVVFPDGMNGVGSDYDEIRADGKTADKRRARVDLGNLEWEPTSVDNIFYANLPLKKIVPNAWKVPALCSKYQESPSGNSTNTPDKCFSFGWQTTLFFVHDSDYTDASTFKAAMNGVYLDYPLATPETYILDEPLVLTTKAGTTEERISPNADGLSAPMVADMTYDVQANNDSASAQYALTAGRLLNNHTLWGRDFDGTQDITGALDNVTVIDALMHFDSINARVGIGTSSPAAKLEVNGSFKAGEATLTGALQVSNLITAVSGLKLTTTKKIWFGDTYYIELVNIGTQADPVYALQTNAGIVSESFITAGAANPNE